MEQIRYHKEKCVVGWEMYSIYSYYITLNLLMLEEDADTSTVAVVTYIMYIIII